MDVIVHLRQLEKVDLDFNRCLILRLFSVFCTMRSIKEFSRYL